MVNVKSVSAVSPTTNVIRFDLNEGYTFKPGQFLYVEGKPFSISSTMNQSFLEITAKISKKEGESVDISEPQGNFYFDENNTEKNVMLIGAGTGIAPLISILRYIKEKEIDINTYFISSSKTEEEILWRREIEALSNCEFTVTGEGWEGRSGRINSDMILNSKLPLHETEYYLCGSQEFVDDMKNMLLNLKIKEQSIKHG